MKTTLHKLLLLSFLSLAFVFNTKAYNYLSASDPQNWGSVQARFSSATLDITPKGVFVQYDLTLEIFAQGYYNNSSQNFEGVLQFDMPEGAIVTDSWLWIDNYISKAKLIDRASANLIYEGIVSRRKDPSILYKNSSTNYELRVYPIPNGNSRKLKITYLLPVEWSGNTVSATLPLDLLKTSNPCPELNIVVHTNSAFGIPHFASSSLAAFGIVSGNLYKASIPSSSLSSLSNGSVQFATPIKNGVYLGVNYTSANEGYYQLAFKPAEVLTINTGKKVAILLDFDLDKSSYSKADIFNKTRQMLHSYFSNQDSFSVIISSFNIYKASGTWIHADSASIDATLNDLQQNHNLSSYTSMPSLLSTGIEFIQSLGGQGSLTLISNSCSFNTINSSNQLIADVMTAMGTQKIPLHIVDYANLNVPFTSIGNSSYHGNEYCYRNLAILTNGTFGNLYNGSNYYSTRNLSETMNEVFSKLENTITNFDVYTHLSSGYCHSRISNTSFVSFPNSYFVQTGRFSGTMPLDIDISGVYNSVSFSESVAVTQFENTDSSTRKFWAGNYIRELEATTPNSLNTIEIQKTSLEHIVLSKYTAFLALENADTIVCDKCSNQNQYPNTLSVEDISKLEESIKVSPNPFTDKVTITFSLSTETPANTTFVSIYNQLGQEVAKLGTDNTSNKEVTLIWDGKDNNGNELAAGIYLVKINMGSFSKTLKVIKS